MLAHAWNVSIKSVRVRVAFWCWQGPRGILLLHGSLTLDLCLLVHLEGDNKWLICLFIGAFVSERFEVSKRKCFESSGEGIIISWMLSQRLEAGLCRRRRRLRRDQVIGSALGE